MPVYKSYYVTDMYNLELGDWPRKGGKGAYLNLANQYEDDGMIVEIPPRQQPEHHMYEALIFVLTGRGATTVSGPGVPKRTVEWKAGSLFSPPLNMTYQHFNASGSEPASPWRSLGSPLCSSSSARQTSSTTATTRSKTASPLRRTTSPTPAIG